MELFADFKREEERAAIARLIETADGKWLAGVGASPEMASRKSDRESAGSEPADADQQIEALEEDMVLGAASASANSDTPVRLTMQLIRESVRFGADALLAAGINSISKERQGGGEEDGDDDDEASALLRKKVLRLDWLNIGRLENLDAFTHVQEVYLQHNLLERVENLDDHTELRFLALAGNRIRNVQGLRHLDKLRFLDLSDNRIDDVDIDEFPPALLILRLAGNPLVRRTPEYAQQFFERFPSLVQIDHYRRDGTAPASSTSSTTSDDGEYSASGARIMPLSRSQLFGPPSGGFEDEVERYKQQLQRSLVSPRPSSSQDLLDSKQSEAFEAQNVNADAAVDPEQYDQQRKVRMAKWKEQLGALATRKAELEEDARPVITRSSGGGSCTSVFSFKRSRALERAHEATDAALADAATHFQQMEMAHQEWQNSHQPRASSRS